jgi:hypothetical protein
MSMQADKCSAPTAYKRNPWNKGKLTGAKPPLRPKHVWSIRTKLQMADRKRDLALFNLPFVPAKTPTATVSQIESWITAAMHDPDSKTKLGVQGLYADPVCGTDFSVYLRKQ